MKQGTSSVKEKLRSKLSKLRKQPHVTDEQKLQAKIDSLNVEAQELNAEASRLQEKAAGFKERAENTPAPVEAPPKREALFERRSQAPESQYETQLKARNLLLGDWQLYEKDVRTYGKKLDRFADTVERLKKDNTKPGTPYGKIQHHFEGLDNAIFNLREQKVELGKAVAAVPLPAGKDYHEQDKDKSRDKYPHALK